ncbi:MAG: GPW/gp25 family protein [Ignavibacteria bacterium]|jgi:phage baseplate assembly protein W
MDKEKQNNSFLGTGWGFPVDFNIGAKGVNMISNEEDIFSSLEILLSTRITERIMQPTYGCNMDKLLFEPINITLVTYIKDLIKDAILYHEPRIILNDVKIDSSADEKGEVKIDIDFTIAATNTRYNYVYPFYKIEGSDINK